MRKNLLLLTLSTFIAGSATAAEPLLLKNSNNLSLSIYNNNLALVKDIRSADLKAGNNDVIFDGVAQRIQPETAIILGQGIKVLEQNYSYNIFSEADMLENSIGQEVTTVRENPKNGENIYEKATLIASPYGNPILKFSYGIDPNFKGRILFNSLPQNMESKPSLTAKINNKKSGNKNLFLAYLTSGLSWKTDYVANISSDNQMDITAWVTVNNKSGIEYNNAKIQLIAGDINNPKDNIMSPRVYATKGLMMNNAMDDANIIPQSLGNYELYTLPNFTSLKDKQTKQISLFEKHNVTYKKELNLTSLLYFDGTNDFEKLHPEITYVLDNIKQANLGISLPAGTVRLYKNDKNGNMQFIGADDIGNTEKNKKVHLNIGEAFNLSVDGKITDVKEKELTRTPYKACFDTKILKTYTVEFNVNNAEDVENYVVIKQHFPENHNIIKENIKSLKPNSTSRKWLVKVPANEMKTLNFSVEIEQKNRICN